MSSERITICVDVDRSDEVQLVDAWFTRWRGRLTFCSQNQGCGCCIDMWEVEGPDEAMAELPDHLKSATVIHNEPTSELPTPMRAVIALLTALVLTGLIGLCISLYFG